MEIPESSLETKLEKLLEDTQAKRLLSAEREVEDLGKTELELRKLAMARKIEDELQYPGQIRITVIRETRCIEFAK